MMYWWRNLGFFSFYQFQSYLCLLLLKNRQKVSETITRDRLQLLYSFFFKLEDKLINICERIIYDMVLKLTDLFFYSKLCEIFKLSNHCTDLQDAATLDYYTSAVWWGKQQSFTTQQLSGFFTMVHTLFTNVKGSGLML